MKSQEQLLKQKMRSDDRILVLGIMDGKKPKNSIGLVDSRLFQGDNSLHVRRNPRDSLWYFKYDTGGLPDPLKQSFTSFNKAYRYAEEYFSHRNVKIIRVED